MTWALEDAAGQPMMVRRWGQGPEIVWIHGLGEWSIGFDPVAAHPAFAGFAHTMVDLPGYGRSPWPDEPEGLEAVATRLAAWLGDRKPALIGHSMGGVLAQLVAERAPVRAIVDVEGNLSRGDCTSSAAAAAYTLDDFLAFGFATMRASIYDRGRTELPLRGYHGAMHAASPRVFHHHALELVTMSEPETLIDRLAALAAPVLYVAGVPDGICVHSRNLLARHGVSWVGLEPAGHWVHLDQLSAFATAVAGFLHGV